jgi:phage terminase Nu1 subunit (DNA packaging protein)
MSNVVGLPVQPSERYVSRGELADLMGVHVCTIDRWVDAGMPSEIWGARMRRFLPSRAIAWARTYEGRRAA